MCAIVDANVQQEVFGSDRPEAGRKFFDWIDAKPGRLVVGGKLLEELFKTPAREYVRQAINAGAITRVKESAIEETSLKLQNASRCLSDDPHVVALAQLSGARLLYSNDIDLMQDFRDKTLIDHPRGKIYSTNEKKNPNKTFTSTHRNLLKTKGLCRVTTARNMG